MKRKLSLLLALVMILSLVPMNAFAATDNRITRVPQVSDEHAFNVATQAPKLRIEEKTAGEFGTTQQVFRLRLTNAEWLDDAKADVDGTDQAVNVAFMNSVTNTVYGNIVSWDKLTASLVEVKVVRVTPAPAETKTSFEIPLLTETTGAGEVTVAIESDSDVSSGKYVFANAAEGNFVVSVSSVKKFADQTTLDTIQIDETKIGSFSGGNEFTLKLPSGYAWKTIGTVTGAGGFPTTPNIKPSSTTGTRDFTIALDSTFASSTTVRGSLLLKNFVIEAKSNARFEDVVLNVEYDGKQQEIKIAEYMDYGVSVKADGDAKEILAGRMASHASAGTQVKDNAHKLQKLVIKEDILNSFLVERKTRIEFPSWVKVIGLDVNKNTGLNSPTSSTITVDKGDNFVEFTGVRNGTGDKVELQLTFHVSVKADATGDITAKVTGRSLAEEYEVVLGKAVAPISAKAEVKDVRIGIQNQELGKIEIVETKAAAIKGGAGRVLTVDLADLGRWTETPKVEVTAGDLDIDVKGIEIDSSNRSVLIIPVKSDSRKAATIAITGGKVTLNRVPAEGDYYVEVGGSAVVENNEGSGDRTIANGYFKQDFAAETLLARVITPADTDTKAVVVFAIDNTTYTVNGEEKTMTVAPYIKDSRTFVSVRYAAEALGVAENAIIWDAATKTVTVRKGANTAQMVQGAKYITVNGMTVPMDTAVENKDGRIMLPIAHLAMALNVSYEWDGTARTVTFK